MGDSVRWWPDGNDDDGRALVDRWIDGEVTWLQPMCIKVIRHHGFTERVAGGWRMPGTGSVVDTSVSPGVIRQWSRSAVAFAKLQKPKAASPNTRWVTPVDAAKAALLISVPPRYPRSR